MCQCECDDLRDEIKKLKEVIEELKNELRYEVEGRLHSSLSE